MRLAIIRVVSVFRKLPVATSSGAEGRYRLAMALVMTAYKKFTLQILRLPQQYAWLRSEDDWTVRCSDVRRTMAKIPFKFVYVVGAFATTAGVLAIYGVYA